MNEVDVILKGGLKGCCSVYPASQLRVFTKDWFRKDEEIVMNLIDIEFDYWETDALADFAWQQMGEQCYPLVYLNDRLIAVGKFPDKEDVVKWIANSPVLNKEHILLLKANFEQNV